MGFYHSNLKRCALTMLFTGALTGSVWAQSSSQIIFSTPVDDGIKSPTADTTEPTANMLVTPRSLTPSFFNSGASLPQLPPPVNPNWRPPANKGSWTLMTPEQIMGVKTPEQMLGLPDKNDDSYLTPEQRFLKRRMDTRFTAATNGMGGFNSGNNDSNPFGQRTIKDTSGAFSKPGQLMGADSPNSPDGSAAKDYSQYSSAPVRSSIFGASQNFAVRPNSAFAMPNSAEPKVDLEQVASMQRFRALIGATSPSDNSSASAFKAPTKPAETAQLDMFGRPLASSANGLTQPASLTTLPSVTGSLNTDTTSAAPKKQWWKPRPAPWLSTGLQPNGLSDAPPMRKFY